MGRIDHVTSETFMSEVVESNVPVLVDFYADWCGPCRMLTPVLEKLAHEYSGRIKIVKVNIDEEPQLAGHFRVHSIPTLLSFRDGTPVDRIVGLGSPGELLSVLTRLATNQNPLVKHRIGS